MALRSFEEMFFTRAELGNKLYGLSLERFRTQSNFVVFWLKCGRVQKGGRLEDGWVKIDFKGRKF